MVKIFESTNIVLVKDYNMRAINDNVTCVQHVIILYYDILNAMHKQIFFFLSKHNFLI